MIDWIYIDNYKCFSNFEYRPKSIELILGDNGTGKSSLFDVLRKLKQFVVAGTSSLELFPRSELCAWDSRLQQRFELGIVGNEGRYQYRLTLEHESQRGKNRSVSEELSFNGHPLYRFDGNDAHLHRDDGSEGPVFPFDWQRSMIATLPERHDNQKLIWFRERLARTMMLTPDPAGMVADSDIENDAPSDLMHNLSSWLRHLFQESPEAIQLIRDSLGDSIDGLQALKHQKTSLTSRSLEFLFNFTEDPRQEFWLPLSELSVGQRQLVGLYTVLYALIRPDHTICIDEPDNYVALREIQPWLVEARDAVLDNESQLWIISHNPELIDYLAPEYGILFYRDEGGAVRTKPFEWNSDELLKPSEIVARGWE